MTKIKAPAKVLGSKMSIPDLEHPSWDAVSMALLGQLSVPRTIAWIKRWVSDNRTKCGDYLNTLAYLSVKGLVTPCYDEHERTHWVVINNVPYGWLTYRVTPEANLGRKRRPSKKKGEEALTVEPAAEPEPETISSSELALS